MRHGETLPLRALPLHKRIGAAWLLGYNGYRMNRKAEATEPLIVLVAYEFGNCTFSWRREVPRAVIRAVCDLFMVVVLFAMTVPLPITAFGFALMARRQARRLSLPADPPELDS